MDDAELVRRALTCPYGTKQTDALIVELAYRIEALIAERDEARAALEAQEVQIAGLKADKFKMRDERDKAKIAASNYAEFNHTWRARAEKAEAERDAARDAALEEAAKMVESPDLPVFKRGWSTSQDAAAISTMMAVAAAIRALKGKSRE